MLAAPPLRAVDAPPGADGARATAARRVLGDLRERIVDGRLAPGAPVDEPALARAAGVSRTPVREALLRLAEERLVDVYPHYGTFVAPIRLADVAEAMVIRAALERASARDAALRAGPSGVAALDAILARQREHDAAGDLAGFHAADEAFHEALAGAARHPHLWRVVAREKPLIDRCRLLTLPQPGRRRRVIAQHAAVVACVARADPDAAEAAMEAHLADAMPSFDAVRAAHPELFHDDDARPRRPAREAGAGREAA